MTDGPLIVQSDKTILLEVDHELATEARHAIAAFAELERAPEHMHSYRLTPLGLWNARAAGLDAEQVLDTLLKYSRFPVPHALLIDIEETMSRYGRLRLEKDAQHGLVMRTDDYPPVLEEVIRAKKIAPPLLGPRIDGETVVVHSSQRGQLKQLLLKLGWPAEDLAGYVDGQPHLIMLDESNWQLRPYQKLATENFWAGGSGVVVLPCGAGKTLVGAAAMATSSTTTLILVTNTVSARQWKDELLKRTSLTEDEIGEYSGAVKEVRPVTIATYQVLTTKRGGLYPHLELVDGHDWGLIIYDEVHLLPAPPIFRMTADLQARRRLGSRQRWFGRTAGKVRCSASSGPSATTHRGRTSRHRVTSRPLTVLKSAWTYPPATNGWPTPWQMMPINTGSALLRRPRQNWLKNLWQSIRASSCW